MAEAFSCEHLNHRKLAKQNWKIDADNNVRVNEDQGQKASAKPDSSQVMQVLVREILGFFALPMQRVVIAMVLGFSY